MIASAIALAAVVAIVLMRPTEDQIAAPSPSPSPTPTPSPTPVAHPPVTGEVEVETVVADSGPINFRSADNRSATPATDEEAVAAFVDAVAAWLDDHLTSLQDEEGGLLDEVAADGMLDGADTDSTTALTGDLASREHPVGEASYHVVVAVAGAPVWAHVRADLTRQDGARRSAEFVFAAGDDGPLLIAAASVEPDAPRFAALAPPEEGSHR